MCVICYFYLTPRDYLSAKDFKELKKNPNTQIAETPKQKLLTLCETIPAKNSSLWEFRAAWYPDCPETNKKYLDPLFEEIKSRYPNKKLVISSELTTYKTKSSWDAVMEHCEDNGIENYQILQQNLMEEKLTIRFKEGKNYIVFGDGAFRDKVQAKMKGSSQLFYYPV